MKELEEALRTLDTKGSRHNSLAVLIPSFYHEAVDMCKNEPELYGDKTPAEVALNAYFDNLQDGDKYDALQQVSELILNLLDFMRATKSFDDETFENLLNIVRGDF